MKRKIVMSVVSLLIVIMGFGTLVNADGAGILEDKYDEVDFEGKTVSIDWLEVVASDERIGEAEEKFNVNLEQLGWPNNEQRVARVMAGDSTHDIWLAYSTDIMELAAERVLYPMEDVLGDEYYQKMIERDPENEYIYKSTNLEFQDQRFSLTPYDPVANVFWFLLYNREIVESEGLTDPQELLAEGEWTWDNARSMMEQVTRDTDGDGSNDQWGMANWDMWGINEINVWHMAISNGERLARIDEDGNYVYNMNSEPVLDGIREIRNWKMDGLIGPNESFDQGAALFQGRHYDTWDQTEVENWGILPFPAGPEADAPQALVWDAFTYVVPINAEDPEGLAVLWDFLSEPEVFPRDRLMETFNQESDMQVVEEYFAQSEFPIIRDYVITEEVFATMSEVMSGERGVEEAFDALAPSVQGHLDDFFDQ